MTWAESFLGDAPRQTPLSPRPERLPSQGGWTLTYGMHCALSSRTAPSPAGRRPGRTPGGPCKGTSAPVCTCTESFHTGPRKAQGPPEGGSGRTLRRSSEAGTAPTGPAGKRCHLSEDGSMWPWLFSAFTSCPPECGSVET